MVHTADNVAAAMRDWSPDEKPLLIGTSARNMVLPRLSFEELKAKLHKTEKRVFLIFGTGFGMTEELLESCDFLLEPLKGAPPLDYRHLSVRSAVSICLDRLRPS